VQETAKLVPGLKQEQVFAGVKTPALGGDLTSVKCKGEWLPLGITVDPLSGLALTIDALSAEDTKTLTAWIEPIAKSVGAQVLVTDDADGGTAVADEVGVQHQVCKAHVLRNTEALIERYQPLVVKDADGRLRAIGVSSEQANALEAMHRRYLQAAPPQEGEHQSLAYRLRLLFLDRWNLWHRLTRYLQWKGPKGETLDGTNNGCRACHWLVGQRTLSPHARLQSTRECAARQSLARLVWQLPHDGGRSSPARILAESKRSQGYSRLVPA
jgi:hypothetical protein